jgi:hypothetical protein
MTTGLMEQPQPNKDKTTTTTTAMDGEVPKIFDNDKGHVNYYNLTFSVSIFISILEAIPISSNFSLLTNDIYGML